MRYLLFHILLQPEVSGGGSAPAAPANGGGGAAPVPGCGGGPMDFGFILLMFAVLYFLMIRPQQKRAKEHDALVKGLKKGDVVRTSGGVRGEITAVDDRDVTLEIAERTRIKVLKSHVTGLDETEAKEKS